MVSSIRADVSRKVLNAIADALAQALCWREIQNQLYYWWDDFLLLGRPGSGHTALYLSELLEHFRELGIPIAGHKVEGPSTTLTFIGILIYTQSYG